MGYDNQAQSAYTLQEAHVRKPKKRLIIDQRGENDRLALKTNQKEINNKAAYGQKKMAALKSRHGISKLVFLFYT